MKYCLFLVLLISISCYTQNERIVWDYCKGEGLTDAGAAALMGNLFAESGIQSVIYENAYHPSIGLSNQEYVDKTNSGEYTNFVHDSVGFGLAQWTYWSRKEALLGHCRGNIGDMYCQLEYLFIELKGTFSRVLSNLKSSDDLYSLTVDVLCNFENPTDKSDYVKNLRYGYAQNYYNTFAG